MEPDYNNNYHNSYQSEFKPNGFDDLHLDDDDGKCDDRPAQKLLVLLDGSVDDS